MAVDFEPSEVELFLLRAFLGTGHSALDQKLQ
jgi:hypothetical protein